MTRSLMCVAKCVHYMQQTVYIQAQLEGTCLEKPSKLGVELPTSLYTGMYSQLDIIDKITRSLMCMIFSSVSVILLI